jgi:hypothetical protein
LCSVIAPNIRSAVSMAFSDGSIEGRELCVFGHDVNGRYEMQNISGDSLSTAVHRDVLPDRGHRPLAPLTGIGQ